MTHLSKYDLKVAERALRKKAQQAFRQGDINTTLRYLDLCSYVGCQFNLIYEDPHIEQLYLDMARQLHQPIENYVAKSNHIVFYDEFCISFVLSLQWVDALAATGKNILYVTTREITEDDLRSHILHRVRRYPNVQIVVIPQGERIEVAKNLYKTITDFCPSQLIIQMRVNSPINMVLGALPKQILRYNINLDDQTLWFGARGIDYVLEFRPFGASVSLQRRRYKKEQLLMVPFYPADDEHPFQGFPAECKDKLVIFSGGDFYKTLDENDTYWSLIADVLHQHPDVIFLFASKSIPEGDSKICQFIRTNNLEDQFIHITFRPDIYQVFAHCDIYMGTCPTSGSLMSQLAAINNKPILQYYAPGTPDDETEQAICINDSFKISFDNRAEFLAEAEKLITDADYRKLQGERLHKAMISPQQFNDVVRKTLETNQSQFPIEPFVMDYKALDDRWFFLEKAGYRHALPYVYGLLGAKDCLLYAPTIFIKKNWNRLINKIKRSIYK